MTHHGETQAAAASTSQLAPELSSGRKDDDDDRIRVALVTKDALSHARDAAPEVGLQRGVA